MHYSYMLRTHFAITYDEMHYNEVTSITNHYVRTYVCYATFVAQAAWTCIKANE